MPREEMKLDEEEEHFLASVGVGRVLVDETDSVTTGVVPETAVRLREVKVHPLSFQFFRERYERPDSGLGLTAIGSSDFDGSRTGSGRVGGNEEIFSYRRWAK